METEQQTDELDSVALGIMAFQVGTVWVKLSDNSCWIVGDEKLLDRNTYPEPKPFVYFEELWREYHAKLRPLTPEQKERQRERVRDVVKKRRSGVKFHKPVRPMPVRRTDDTRQQRTHAAICPVCGAYAAVIWEPVLNEDNQHFVDRFIAEWDSRGLLVQVVTEEQERAASFGCDCTIPDE